MNSHERRKQARAQGYTMKRQQTIITTARLLGAIRNPEKVHNYFAQVNHHHRVAALKEIELFIMKGRT